MTKSQTCETITIGSTEIMLANPAELRLKWVGQKELIKQVLAAWMVIDEKEGKSICFRPPWIPGPKT